MIWYYGFYWNKNNDLLEKVIYYGKKTSDEKTNKRTVPGSTAFVPSSAGLLIASEVIKDLLF